MEYPQLDTSAGNGSRVSPVGRDDSRRRGRKRSIEEDDDEDFGSLRVGVLTEDSVLRRKTIRLTEIAAKFHNNQGWRDFGSLHVGES